MKDLWMLLLRHCIWCQIQPTLRALCLLVEVGGVVVDDGGDLLLRHDSLGDHLGKRTADAFLDESNHSYLIMYNMIRR